MCNWNPKCNWDRTLWQLHLDCYKFALNFCTGISIAKQLLSHSVNRFCSIQLNWDPERHDELPVNWANVHYIIKVQQKQQDLQKVFKTVSQGFIPHPMLLQGSSKCEYWRRRLAATASNIHQHCTSWIVAFCPFDDCKGYRIGNSSLCSVIGFFIKPSHPLPRHGSCHRGSWPHHRSMQVCSRLSELEPALWRVLYIHYVMIYLLASSEAAFVLVLLLCMFSS